MEAEDGLAQSATTWPVPEFHFSVEISDVGTISCKEVSGLDIEFDVIEYHSGDMKGFTKIKMPGLRKSGDVTLKKAIFKDDKKTHELAQHREDEHHQASQRHSGPAGRERKSCTELETHQCLAEEIYRRRLQGRRQRRVNGNYHTRP